MFLLPFLFLFLFHWFYPVYLKFDLFAVHTKKQRYFTTVKVNVKENRRDTPECTIKRDRQHCAHKTQNDDKQSKLHNTENIMDTRKSWVGKHMCSQKYRQFLYQITQHRKHNAVQHGTPEKAEWVNTCARKRIGSSYHIK
jgi:hypothetical protein